MEYLFKKEKLIPGSIGAFVHFPLFKEKTEAVKILTLTKNKGRKSIYEKCI
jgi:hypothetical protein